MNDTNHAMEAFNREAKSAMKALDTTYGQCTGGVKLTKSDVVTLMDGWNKVLAFETHWKECCFMRWRILEAREAVMKGKRAANNSVDVQKRKGEEKKEDIKDAGDEYSVPLKGGAQESPSSTTNVSKEIIFREARRLVEQNEDPLAQILGPRLFDGKNLLLSLFDDSIRSLCPHTQTVAREAYCAISQNKGASYGFDLECNGKKRDILPLLARCGVLPAMAKTLCEAFLFSMTSHVPYALEDEKEDLALSPSESAFARFVCQEVARPLIEETQRLRNEFSSTLYVSHIPKFWTDVRDRMGGNFGVSFYRNLLSDYPDLLDYFNRTDMDKQSEHIAMAMDLIVKYPENAGGANGAYRKFVEHLADVHLQLGIPTSAYPMVGETLVKTLSPFADGFCEYVNWTSEKSFAAVVTAKKMIAKGDDGSDDTPKENHEDELLTKEVLLDGIVQLYAATMSFTFFPMLRQERLIASAADFYSSVAEELSWSPAQLSRRLLEIKLEVASTGTYNQTTEEIRTGMRLAWRNSSKCIGRISWNTLEVRDCRHVTHPADMIKELERHLEIATAGTNIQSVMTVFRPKKPDEAWGVRLWTEQFIRYACYKDIETGEILGDPANLEFTTFLLQKGLWTPPTPRTKQDVLPLVFSVPGEDKPYVHQFSPKYIDECPIIHPDCEEIGKLGYRWATVPIINTFNIDLGGVEYGTLPFNGWFCSTEIVRDLMERYPCTTEFAKAMGIDPNTKMLETRMQHEIERAVNYSFDCAGYTIVDPRTAAEQFSVHCRKEKEAGRECPSQWSWIGGLVGPTNQAWHREMRDFKVSPQYEYTSHHWLVSGYAEEEDDVDTEIRRTVSEQKFSDVIESFDEKEGLVIPRVLIIYGSETGTAEAAATRMSRLLRLIRPTIAPLNDMAGMEEEEWIGRYTHVLALCSTFGKGLPPVNAENFFKEDLPSASCLAGTEISVLALGSTIYPDFCKAGIDLEKRLKAAGGKVFVPIHKADAACDSAGTITEWINIVTRLILPPNLKAKLEDLEGSSNEPFRHRMIWTKGDEAKTPPMDGVERFTWPESKTIKCHLNEELLENGNIDIRSTRRIAFEVPPGDSYVSGDHLSVKPLNSIESVQTFATLFKEELCAAMSEEKGKESDALMWAQLQKPFKVECIDNGQVYPARLSFGTSGTLSDILQSEVSLSLSDAWAADAITLLSDYLPTVQEESEEEKKVETHPFVQKFHSLRTKIETGGKSTEAEKAMDSFLSTYPNIMELLSDFAVYQKEAGSDVGFPPLAEVLAIMPRLQPRLYSISSSNRTDPTRLEVTVGVVHDLTKDGVEVHGVCSNYLARLVPGDRVNASIRESSFRGPSDVKKPVIMVGAGTGLAPMMGFLSDRAIDLKEDEDKSGLTTNTSWRNCHLFFGARHEGEQIYNDKISEYESSNVLRLHLALSRSEHVPKSYVQDAIIRFGSGLAALLLEDGCRYYVCGDAAMADRCYEACLEALKTRMSRVRAVQHLRKMRVEGRWQSDLWGLSAALEEDYQETKKLVSRRKRNSALNWLSQVKTLTGLDDLDDEF